MSIWTSFRRISGSHKNREAGDGRNPLRKRAKSASSLKPRGLRMEQFEHRLLLSITSSMLDELVAYDQPIFGNAVRPLPEPGQIQLIALADSPDDFRPIQPLNRNAADTANVEYITAGGSLGLDLDGSGYTVGVWDAGAGPADAPGVWRPGERDRRRGEPLARDARRRDDRRRWCERRGGGDGHRSCDPVL